MGLVSAAAAARHVNLGRVEGKTDDDVDDGWDASPRGGRPRI